MEYSDKLKILRDKTETRRVQHIAALKTALEDAFEAQPVQNSIQRSDLAMVAERASDPIITFKATCKARHLDSQYVIPFAVKQLCEVIECLPKSDEPGITYDQQLEAVALYLQDNPEAWDVYSFFRADT